MELGESFIKVRIGDRDETDLAEGMSDDICAIWRLALQIEHQVVPLQREFGATVYPQGKAHFGLTASESDKKVGNDLLQQTGNRQAYQSRRASLHFPRGSFGRLDRCEDAQGMPIDLFPSAGHGKATCTAIEQPDAQPLFKFDDAAAQARPGDAGFSRRGGEASGLDDSDQ